MPKDQVVLPTISHAEILKAKSIKRGFIKCRLVHMPDRSFVLPDLLFSSELEKSFYAPKFFTPNQIAFFGGDGSADHCKLTLELLNGTDVEVAFFQKDLVTACRDGSFIYKCAFARVKNEPMATACGKWRRRGQTFELLLFHHTNEVAEKNINESEELWSSGWNIQGNKKLENIGYCYFTSIKQIENEDHLQKIAMSQSGVAHFLPTNTPYRLEFASALPVPIRTPSHMDRSLGFWVDVQIISPNHIWLHRPMSEPAYYEIVLPHVYRVGVNPGCTLPISEKRIGGDPAKTKALKYIVVGDASIPEGLIAPYHEEETLSLAKIDDIPEGSEIIQRWHEKQNSYLYREMSIELAKLTRGN